MKPCPLQPKHSGLSLDIIGRTPNEKYESFWNILIFVFCESRRYTVKQHSRSASLTYSKESPTSPDFSVSNLLLLQYVSAVDACCKRFCAVPNSDVYPFVLTHRWGKSERKSKQGKPCSWIILHCSSCTFLRHRTMCLGGLEESEVN